MSEHPLPEAIQQALMHGDLSALTPEHQLLLYHQTCGSLGLNPLTNPLRYLTLKDGDKPPRLVLYAGKGCADQLRGVHNITTEILSRTIEDGLCIVVSRSRDASGRFVDDLGAVSITKETGAVWKTAPSGKRYKESEGVIVELQGEDRANAIMKAITKSKNRSTLSFCGLGMLDESEIDQVSGAVGPEATGVQPSAALPPSTAVARPVTRTPTPAPVPAHPVGETAQEPAAAPAVAPDSPPRERSHPSQTPTPLARKPIDKLSQQECVFRLQDELKRLTGTAQDPASKQDRTDVLTAVFGPGVETFVKAAQLGKSRLQRGLVQLEAMATEPPPEDFGPYHARLAEADGPAVPPSAGNPQEGPQPPPGDTSAAGPSPGDGDPTPGEPDATGAVEEPPEEPRMNGLVVDTGDVRTLLVWAYMHGQHEAFEAMTHAFPTEQGTPVLSKIAYQRTWAFLQRQLGGRA